MKIEECIKQLKHGKRIRKIPSELPTKYKDFFQLCQQNTIIRILCNESCAGTVMWIASLEDCSLELLYSKNLLQQLKWQVLFLVCWL